MKHCKSLILLFVLPLFSMFSRKQKLRDHVKEPDKELRKEDTPPRRSVINHR